MNNYSLIALLMFALVLTSAKLTKVSTRGWVRKERASPNDIVQVGFAIKQNNLNIVDALFWKLSDPASELYGQYLSKEEVRELVFNAESVSAVMEYLSLHQISFQGNPDGEYIKATMTVSQAEQLFQTQFHHFQSVQGHSQVKTHYYQLPAQLEEHVTAVFHMAYFPPMRPARMQSFLNNSNEQLTTPSLIQSVYGMTTTSCSTTKSSQSLFESLGQQFSPQDLTSFQKAYDIPVQAVDKIIGSNKPTQCARNPQNCGEANLDVQYIKAVAQNCETWYWDISGNGDSFMEWVYAVAAMENPPLVHSMSYGAIESEEPSVQQFNTEVQKLGLRGITVIVSSGDDGVANFQARSDSSQCGYNPSFPATSPYVTAVGATQGPEAGNSETACSSKTGGLITTGGGFSDSFSQPSWQKDAVSKYFGKLVQEPMGGYNKEGRGIPDVAVMGHNYLIYDGGQQLVVSGTSASAPVFAGMITLINDARLAAGKPSLGFLNQALYSLDSDVFNDITEGSNNCCAAHSNPVCCEEGFSAAQGWDPLTGLGSPQFEKLKAALLAL